MITAQDLQSLAHYLVENHGPAALTYADRAVDEMLTQGEHRRADAWRALRSFVGDFIDGRMDASSTITFH